jgi:hypothetical protein
VRDIRSTYPCRSHSENVQMNVVGIVVLAFPPRDPIRSKRHNGRCLRALHTYSATTSPPPRSSKVRWSDRWDQQHDGMVLMVESICGQDFAYTHKVEEDRQKTSQTRARGETTGARRLKTIFRIRSHLAAVVLLFYKRSNRASQVLCLPSRRSQAS